MYDVIITGICWGAFFLMWIGGGIYNAWKGPRVKRKGTEVWRFWLIGVLAVWLLTRNDSGSYRVWLQYRFDIPWVKLLGITLLVISTLFTLWSRITLGTMWSSSVTIKRDHQLRTDGPYRITRHPIYSGILGMIVGSILINGIPYLIALVIYLIVILIKVPQEERFMIENFGEEYVSYKKRVPRLIPGWPRL